MKANELRIGNLVYVIKCATVQITANHILSIFEGDKDYSGIPLNEDWLVKFGFIKDNYGVFYKTKDGSNTSESIIQLWAKKCLVEQFDISIGQEFGDTHNLCFIKYVHQLQNLYFALTGEELTIKEPTPPPPSPNATQ